MPPALAPPGPAAERGIMGIVVQPLGPGRATAGADLQGAAGSERVGALSAGSPGPLPCGVCVRGRPFGLNLTTPGTPGQLRRVLQDPLRGGAGRLPQPGLVHPPLCNLSPGGVRLHPPYPPKPVIWRELCHSPLAELLL